MVVGEAGLVRAPQGAVDCLQRTVRTEGVSGLLKGLSAPLVMAGALNAILFSVNGTCKRVVAGCARGAYPLRSNLPTPSESAAPQSVWTGRPVLRWSYRPDATNAAAQAKRARLGGAAFAYGSDGPRMDHRADLLRLLNAGASATANLQSTTDK